MSNGKRRYFPGANTGRGFIGHFEGIVPPWSEPHYTYVLKGGPGVGKSTLMKKCAAIARANGFTVEEFRCASDPESLDAVRIPQRRLVLLDGRGSTAKRWISDGFCTKRSSNAAAKSFLSSQKKTARTTKTRSRAFPPQAACAVPP